MIIAIEKNTFKLLKISGFYMKYLQDVYFTNLNVTCNAGGYFSIDPPNEWGCDYDIFDQCKFYFVTEGSFYLCVDGVEYIGKKGDWFFIPAYKEHAFYNLKDSRFSKFWMHFSLYPNAKTLSAIGLPICVKTDSGGLAQQLFEEFANLNSSDELSDKLVIKSIVLRLLAEFIRLSKRESVSVKSIEDERFDGLLRYINFNLEKNFSIKELAERYFVHPNHFIRLFKSKVGQTPARYIKERKMEMAKRLLESSTLSVTAIAEKTGMVDVANFSRTFKKFYNLSPIEYRNYFKNVFEN